MTGRRKTDPRTMAIILVLLGVSVTTLAVSGLRGWNEESLRLLVRLTARLSVVLFLLAFALDEVVALIGRSLPPRPPPHRATCFLGFALSHLFHLAALAALAWWFPEPFLNDIRIVTLVGGGLAYAFIFGIAIWFIARRDAVSEPALVNFGMWYIWVVFTRAYALRVGDEYLFTGILILLVAALVVRLLVFRKLRGGARPLMGRGSRETSRIAEV